jgi:Tfp pilus assembly protein PilP
MKKLIIAAFVMAIFGTSLAIITDSDAQSPLVIRKKVVQLDPLLTYDFKARVFPAPPKYDPNKKVDPFMDIFPAQEKKDVIAANVPETPLTKWRTSQLKLTSIIVNHAFAYAYFTTPADARVYRAEVGNYIGKSGTTISCIKTGVVSLSDGNVVAINR